MAYSECSLKKKLGANYWDFYKTYVKGHQIIINHIPLILALPLKLFIKFVFKKIYATNRHCRKKNIKKNLPSQKLPLPIAR